MSVIISPAGGREQSAEEEVDGALQGLPGREFRAFKHGGMNEAANGLQPEFDGESRIDLGADLALGQTGANQAAENIRHIALPKVVDFLVELGRKALQVMQHSRTGQRKIRPDDLHQRAQFLGEIQLRIGQDGIQPAADGLSDFLDDRIDELVLAPKMAVEGFFAHAELVREIVHRQSAVAGGEEAGAGGMADPGGGEIYTMQSE